MTPEQMARKLKDVWMKDLETHPDKAWKVVAAYVLSQLQATRREGMLEAAGIAECKYMLHNHHKPCLSDDIAAAIRKRAEEMD